MANPWEETYAPATTGDPESFKKEYLPAAQRAGKELGVDPDIILGQWGNETGWGKSIVPGTNNLGNIKGKSDAIAKDNQTGSTDSYKKYKSTDEFADDYVNTVKKNYPKAVGAGNNVQKFTSGLKGYAQDKQYPSKVKAASDTVAKAPTAPWEQNFEAAPITPGKKPAVAATSSPAVAPKDKDYASGSSSKATFGEAARDVGQAGLSLASGLAGSAAGLAAELGASAFSPISDPKSIGGLGVDPYALKNKVANALTYEPKTIGAKEIASIASKPGEILSAPIQKATELAPKELKPAVDIAGNALLTAIPGAAGEALKRPFVGGEAARTAAQGNVAAFKKAGVDRYALGQASEGGFTKGAVLSNKLIEKQRDQLAANADKIADKVSATKTPEEAGKVIRDAIGGTPETKSIASRKNAAPQLYETGKKIGGYIDNARQIEGGLYDDMYKKVGRDTKFAYPNLFKALDDMTSQNPNLRATSGGFVNRGILDLRSRLVDDAGKTKQLGYEDARWLRSKLGELTDPRQIVPGDTSRVSITPHQADALYAAMSEDMMAGVASKGPRAEIATLKANQFTRQLHQEISNHLQPIMNSKLLKDTFDNATSGTKEGNERVAATMKTLDPMQKDAVKSVFFRELGRQGDTWNVQKFLDSYSKLHPDAKTTMFGGPGKTKFRNDLDAMAKVADKLNVDENTWHKLKTFLLTNSATGAIAATGAVTRMIPHSVIGTLLAGPAMGFLTGSLVRSPKFIDWFLKSANKTKGSSIPLVLANLKSREKDMSPQDQQETDDYINKVNESLKPDSGVPQ